MKITALRTSILSAVLVVAVVSINGCTRKSEEKTPDQQTTVTTSTAGKGDLLTARGAFLIAQTVARDWAPDVAFVDLSNFKGSSASDGTAMRWRFEFNSITKGKRLEVHVRGGKILQKIAEKYVEQDVIAGEWIDSSEAMEIALGYFGKAPIKNYWLGLRSNNGIISWYIKCDYDEGAPDWAEVNALTRELIRTWKG